MNKEKNPIAFTKRELQIINLAAEGFSNREIAGKLNFSLNTVKNDITNIIKKSGAKNRINAVYILTLEGIIDLNK